MITYHPIGKSGVINVKLNGQTVGEIRRETAPFGSPVDTVYRYWPTGVRSVAAAGSPYTSVARCKQSLEN